MVSTRPPRGARAGASKAAMTLCVALFATSLAAGQETAQPPLDETDQVIIVTATRLDSPVFTQPYAIYRITREDLDASGGRTLSDSFSHSPGVFTQHTAPNQASPFVRGLTGEQTLLLFDGVRYSHAMMRPGPNQYAALIADESIEIVDIILGSSSTVTGSDGLTGALDFKLAPAGRGVGKPASTYLQTRISSAEGASTAAGVDGETGAWAYTVEGSYADYHDLIGGWDAEDRLFDDRFGAEPGATIAGAEDDRIPNTGYTQYAFAARAAYTGGDANRVEVAAGHTSMQDAPRPDGYYENSGKTSRISRFYDPQQFTYFHARHVLTPPSGGLSRLQTSVWCHNHYEAQYREEYRDLGVVGTERYRRREYVNAIDSLGLDIQATSDLTDAHELTYGLTYVDEVTSNEFREFRSPAGDLNPATAVPHNPADWDASTTVPDGSTYGSLGAFVQEAWHVADQVDVVGGVRYSSFAWDADLTGRNYPVNRADGSADNVTGSLRVARHTGSTNLFFGVSQGFRAPNLTNLAGNPDRSSSGIDVLGNPELEPEQSVTAEVGWRYAANGDELAVSVYYTSVDDLIQPYYADIDPVDGVLEGYTVNAESSYLYGGELKADIGLIPNRSPLDGRLAFTCTVSTTRARAKVPQDDGTVIEQFISRANRTFGTFGIRYRSPKKTWWAAEVRWSHDYDDVAPTDANDVRMTVAGDADGRMPGYAVIDLKTGWTSEDRTRSVTYGIENLLDETYRDPGSGVDGPGINFVVRASRRF